MIACFSLRHQSASFEFFLWLVLVQAKGATEIVIDPTDAKLKWFPAKETNERVQNILVPGAALAGLPVRVGKWTGDAIRARAPDLFDWVRSGGTFTRLRSVKPPGAARYTVTLRRHHLAPGRNSNESAWRQFADLIGATVIEDYSVQPIHLHDRMALYAGAQINFGVCNGPCGMIALSEYPVAMFAATGESQNSLVKNGTPRGGDFPWARPNQKIIWNDDTFDNIARSFVDWKR